METDLQRQIHPSAKNAWRISGGLQSLLFWFIPLSYPGWYQQLNLPYELVYLLGGLTLLYTLLSITIIPVIRWRRWRYRIGAEEIELRHGLFIITQTLIPVYRVQHVDMRQGPIYSFFNLASVTISTAATTHEIPALSVEAADIARSRISELARTAREDVSV